MSELLDELARSLAKPMSRSRSLRLLGGALVSAATAGVLGRAEAASTRLRAASDCLPQTCAYRYHPCDRGTLCEPSGGEKMCCKAGDVCCSDGPRGGNFRGHCTGSSEVSRAGYYCCPQGCECYRGICCGPGTMRSVDKTGFPICCERGDTLCDHPQARGGVTCCKKVCGPDITDELEETLSRVRRKFADWGNVTKTDVCAGMITMPAAAVAWDILELGPGGREKFTKQHPDCSTCGLSVQVGRDCHYAGSVNYVAFGLMMRLCHDFVADSIADWYSQEEMLEMVYIHKNLNWKFTQGANFQASNEWALVGYRDKSIRPIPVGDRQECNKQLCGEKYSGPGFTVWWSFRKIRP